MIKYLGLMGLFLSGIGLGIWLGQKQAAQAPVMSAATMQKLLYYRHPMNPKVTSLTPAKDEMGMAYLPVYEEGQSLPDTVSQSGKVLYYRHPMGAADISSVPKKDEMGMDYLPVFADEANTAGQIIISPEKIQKLGVKTAITAKRTLTYSIRAQGGVEVDERRIHAIAPKFGGWIQRLHVNTSGQSVSRGQPLLEIYSPELISAQQEYLIAKQGLQAMQQASAQARETEARLADNALQRLHYWDIADAQLKRLQNQEKILETLPLLSPVNGVVLAKPAIEGMRFVPGEVLFRIVDLSTVWLIAEVFEQDSGLVYPGLAIQVLIDAYPGKPFSGKIDFIYPTVATETRTVKVRIELPNNSGLLKPGLYGKVTIATQPTKPFRLVVPDSAVIDSGERQIVFLKRGEGRFEPRRVTLGLQADGYREISAGLQAGDEVVIRANFLIDAESNFKSALESFTLSGAGLAR
ncbi:MAG: efflux RND transporter periplasmic adaptor subunit [Methylococcaceae bacterium]|jgi:Cu(I)/Ag(I) efflux system membrane fusion protein